MSASTRQRRSAQQSEGPLVVATKLNAPPKRGGHIERMRLCEILTMRRHAKLTLLSAPPGSGKTTLLSEWSVCDEEDRPFAWLSLDETDSDPVQFWTGIISALRSVLPDVGADALAAFQVPGTPVIETGVPLLINELAERREPMILVLDDYHVVANEEVHESVRYLLGHMPSDLHLAVATRADPALPLARLRARDELIELRASHLRFNRGEALHLLNDTFGLALSDEDVDRLQAQTEGWVAGLQLAGLSLRRAEHPQRFIASFAGDDRAIVDYLGTEVLAAQRDEVRDFLLETSILDRLCAGLCDSVRRRGDSAAMLAEIDSSNLFLVALDEKRHWYRYHRLFADLLQHELTRRDRDAAAELHCRAARWHQDNGTIAEAINHAIRGRDLALAGELIAVHWSMYFNRGRLATVSRWLSELPASQVAADSRLWLAQVWTSMDRGRLDEVAPLIAQAASLDDGCRGGHPLGPWPEVLAALHAFKAGDVGRARCDMSALLEREADAANFAVTTMQCVLTATAYWCGDSDAAIATSRDGCRLAALDGNRLAELYMLGYRALAELDGGRGTAARELVEHADAMIEREPGLGEHFVAMIPRLAAGALAAGDGDQPTADRELTRAIDLAKRGAARVETAAALIALADVRRGAGDIDETTTLFDEAEEILSECADPGRLRGRAFESHPRRRRTRSAPVGIGDELSERELAVLRLLRTQLSQREIGSALYVSLNTVKTHTRHLFAKLGVTSREEAVARARELGLL